MTIFTMFSPNIAFLLIIISALIHLSYCAKYRVVISDNGPVIVGAAITFKAELFTSDGKHPYGSFRFLWSDNTDPPNSHSVDVEGYTATWTVIYPRSKYKSGKYNIFVSVEDWYVVWYPIISNSSQFVLSDNLHGDIVLRQNGKSKANYYVAVNDSVLHEISLSHPDYAFLEAEATSVLTYWFIDCVYLGSSTDYSLIDKYATTNTEHTVEAVIIASYDPIPEPITLPPTTTTTPKNSTDAVHLQAKRSIEKDAINVVDYIEYLKSSYNVAGMKSQIQSLANVTNMVPWIPQSSSCINDSVIQYDSNKTYGYFRRKITVADPVAKINVSGNNWLIHGDILMMQVTCNGLAPFQYCLMYWKGAYNVSGDETCLNPITSPTCDFPVIHYFPYSGMNTVVLIISNEVSTNISTVVVNVYNEKRQPQLSVIVVPVSFSIVAVVLIIFGVAYYLQSRSRYTIEVADFDFGEQCADLEYKTFIERLRESFNNALRWGTARDPDEPDAQGTSTGNNLPSPDRNKYGTMT